jgi:hypothetical protein
MTNNNENGTGPVNATSLSHYTNHLLVCAQTMTPAFANFTNICQSTFQ